MRTVVVVALVLAAVLAGCSGAPEPQGSDGPSDLSTTGSPTASAAETTAGTTDRARTTTTSLAPTSSTAGQNPTATPTTSTTGADGNDTVMATFVLADGENVTVELEVADDPAERREGLMFRQSLPRNHGMVFVYSEPRPLSFWMKNTYIPLDMVFVDAEKRVLNVEHAEVQLNASSGELKRYHSDGDAQFVIELNRGFANRTGVGPGTRVVFHEPLLEESGD